MAGDEVEGRPDAMMKYVAGYRHGLSIQAAAAAIYDNQLKTLAPLLAQLISGYPRGTLMDIGCGGGVLLAKLARIPAFSDRRDWTYFGIDFPEQLDSMLHLAAELRLHRRVEAWTPEAFLSRWPTIQQAAKPYLCVIRNVFHELDIKSTSKLLFRLIQKLEPEDYLIVQDLINLEIAERGSACWTPEPFTAALRACGFLVTHVEEPSKSGNRWFTCTAQKAKGKKNEKTEDEVLRTVFEQRRAQFDEWSRTGVQHLDNREEAVAQLDFDLQLTALHQQLLRAGDGADIQPLTPDEERKALRDTLQKALLNLQLGPGYVEELQEPKHFRDRAQDQDWLEAFLIGAQSVAVLRGGPYIGKTYLATKVLANRAHHKKAILLDVPSSASVWNLLEQYFTALGAKINPEVLTGLRKISFADAREVVRSFVSASSARTIVALDHFERLLDPSGRLSDSEIIDFLTDLGNAPEAKLIISSRTDPKIGFVPAERIAERQPIGRFPRGEHVENLLDDFIDRTLLKIDIYPQELLDAIDRHPYLTVLAALIIQREGAGTLWDERFIGLVKNQLRDDLLERLVDDFSRPAIEALSLLRCPVPIRMLEEVAGSSSVQAACEAGLLYFVRNRAAGQLVTCIGAIRKSSVDAEGFAQPLEFDAHNAAELALHMKIAESYRRLYALTDDPRWLRELHYHTLVSGDVTEIKRFGVLYKTEIFWAGNYWFRTLKRYKEALWAFETVETLGLRSTFTEMRRAACLMRMGKKKDGESIYERLIVAFPAATNIKTSMIDSLLFCNEQAKALAKLEEFQLAISDDPWIAHEYGRAYFGLHRYKEAAHAFECELNSSQEVTVYESLARTYYRLGESDKVEQTLRAGLRRHHTSNRLQLRFAGHLIRKGTAVSYYEAEAILDGLVKLFPTEGRILQQYCKLLCLTGRASEADGIWKSKSNAIYPEEYKLAIQVDILIATHRWERALELLGSAEDDNEHSIGMKKKVFLRWARTETGERKEIAKRGLAIPLDRSLRSNMPLMVAHARLASLAQDQQAFDEAVEIIALTNGQIAAMLRTEDAALSYWEDDYFVDLD